MKLKVIYEDQWLIVVLKPAGIPAQDDLTGDKSMLTYVQAYLAEKEPEKKHQVGIVHRLDRPVGGLMVWGKNPKVTASLSKAFQERKIQKKYLAVVEGQPHFSSARLEDYLFKDARKNCSRVVTSDKKGAKKALLNFKQLGESKTIDDQKCSLLEVDLQTGRHHQIRVQLSNAMLPLWGDHKYNPRFSQSHDWHNIALWAYQLVFKHPEWNQEMFFTVYPEGQYPFELWEGELNAEK